MMGSIYKIMFAVRQRNYTCFIPRVVVQRSLPCFFECVVYSTVLRYKIKFLDFVFFVFCLF